MRKRSRIGTLAATAMATLLAAPAAAATTPAPEQADDARACYRPKCGTSVKGHEGTCGGTRVEALTDEKSCKEAGGAWITAEEAEKLKH